MLQKDKKDQARAVFEILVRENQAMLMTYLQATLPERSVADDLFQETMLVVWQKLDEYDRTRPFGPWLRGIAARLVMAHFRKVKNNAIPLSAETLEYLSQQLQHISERPGDTWGQKTEALTACIETLPDHHKQAINLRYFEQIPVAKISGITKVSAEAIKKRLQRARAQLLDCLKRKKVIAELAT